MKRLWKICLFFSFILIGYACWTGYSIWSFSYITETKKADAAVVLGAAVDGQEPSPVFEKRIDHALWLLERHDVETLIFTGGKGNKSEVAEAEAAAAYAVKKGVKEKNILTETKSQITEENLTEAKKLAAHHNIETIALVSDPLHMKRAVTIAEDLDMTVFSSPTSDSAYESLRTKIPFFLREWFFYNGYQILSLFR